jgi:uncharacterized protein (DUF433 family)
MVRHLSYGITADPAVMHGRPVIGGTRVPVAQILGHLAAGDAVDDLAHDYGVTPQDIMSCLAYAAKFVAGKRYR